MRLAHLDHPAVVPSDDEVAARTGLDAGAQGETVVELAIGDMNDLDVVREAPIDGIGDNEELVRVVAPGPLAQLGP